MKYVYVLCSPSAALKSMSILKPIMEYPVASLEWSWTHMQQPGGYRAIANAVRCAHVYVVRPEEWK